MTPGTLAPPPTPEASDTHPTAGGPPPSLPVRAPLSGRRRRDPTGRITRRGVGVSLALHALLAVVVLLLPREPFRALPGFEDAAGSGSSEGSVSYVDIGAFPEGVPDGIAGASPAPDAETGSSTGLVTPVDTGSAAPPTPAVPTPLRPQAPGALRFPTQAPAGVRPVPGTGGAPGAGGGRAPQGAPGGVPGARPGGGGGGGTGLPGGLNPELRDPRLVVGREAAQPRELTPHERYERELASRIRALADSAADVAERERRARNWTFKDSQGREWGIADGGVPVIAGRRLPTAVAPPIPREDRDMEEERRTERRQRAEIDRQAESTERDRYLRERQRAVRARNDSIRAANRRDP